MGYKVVLTDQVFPDTNVEEETLRKIDARLTVLTDHSPAAIAEAAADADALITTYAPISAETLSSLERCKVIARYGIGVDNIDLDAAKQRGIVVTNVPDYCLQEVADHTLTLLLAVSRKVIESHISVRSGGWGIKSIRPIHRLSGQKLGLIGYGNIGRLVAERARAFGLQVSVHDPYLSPDRLDDGIELVPELDDLLSSSDIISVHAPLTDSTRGLINGAAISKMKRGAALINTSRGPIVETEAVVDGLKSGYLSGAGLDVFAEEPPSPTVLENVPNLVATPHSAFYSEEAIAESQAKAADCVVAVLSGTEPSYRVV